MANQNLTQIIEKIFRHQGGWTRLKGELAVYYWPRIAGPDLATKVEALRFRDGNLYLQTDNPALAHQVSLLNYDIVNRFQRILGRGVVKTIKIKIAPTTPIVQSKEISVVELSETDQTLINECCKEISDEELAAPFRKMMRQVKTRNQRLLKEAGTICRSCNTVITSDYAYCPCCERQIHQEIHDYLQYLHKTNQEVALNTDSQPGLSALHENLMRQILKQEHPPGPDRH